VEIRAIRGKKINIRGEKKMLIICENLLR